MAKQEMHEPVDLKPFIGKRIMIKFHVTEGHCLANFTIEGELKFDGEQVYQVEEEQGLITFEESDVAYMEPFDEWQMLHFRYV